MKNIFKDMEGWKMKVLILMKVVLSSGENNEFDSENMSFSDFDHEKLLANFLLELREI